ncbi:Phosphatidylinositide phosphatase SAC2 [Clydaea vesicula]|uniref:Phosphatidylinositide phosphatase SAC2 n=1 Tax=Clydaea vesicula TaxID=447962 RepID=A0AAD5Y2U1_9FUNG|nr:Phosphatidylinositide phosphatase SAC2 [Clydaea vesicula]
MLKEKLHIAVDKDQFFFIKQNIIGEFTKIVTLNFKSRLTRNFNESLEFSLKKYEFFGIIGIISLDSGDHLILTVKRENVGHIKSNSVFRIDDILILPFNELADIILARYTNNVELKETTKVSNVEVKSKPVNDQLNSKFDAILKKNNVVKIVSEKERSNHFGATPTKKTVISTLTEVSSAVNLGIKKSFGYNLTECKISKPNFSKDSSFTLMQNAISLTSKKVTDTTKRVIGDENDGENFEELLIKEITRLLTSGLYFYSKEIDLTNSFQRQSTFSDKQNLFLNLDKRFFWNEHLLDTFIKQNVEDFIIPIINGFVQIESLQIKGLAFDFVLISRRSRDRSGLRYERRGTDEEGNCANYVETEELIFYQNHVACFSQIRGSIPVLFHQSAQSLKPIPIIDGNDDDSERALLSHFARQTNLYNKVICVNLVHQQDNRESIVGSKFKSIIEKLNIPQVQYNEFDFHEHCKSFNYENLSILLNIIEGDLNEQKYFWSENDVVFSKQEGIFRTNCMDCLDRTNVVQSLIARTTLKKILFKLGIQSPDCAEDENLENIFKTIWANNGLSNLVPFFN